MLENQHIIWPSLSFKTDVTHGAPQKAVSVHTEAAQSMFRSYRLAQSATIWSLFATLLFSDHNWNAGTKSSALCLALFRIRRFRFRFRSAFVDVRRAFRCRSVCETARGSGEARDRLVRIRWLSLAPEWTGPDRLASIPGTLPTTAGDWPEACQSALALPPCPMRMQKHKRGGSL